MLPAAEYQPWLRAPNLFAAACAQPLFTTLAHELSSFNCGRMRCAAKPRDWNIPLVANSGINRYASIRIGNVLDRSTNVHDSGVIVAHESLVRDTPTWQIRRERVVPEIDWRLDEVIGQHTTADDSRVVVIELSRSDR